MEMVCQCGGQTFRLKVSDGGERVAVCTDCLDRTQLDRDPPQERGV